MSNKFKITKTGRFIAKYFSLFLKLQLVDKFNAHIQNTKAEYADNHVRQKTLELSNPMVEKLVDIPISKVESKPQPPQHRNPPEEIQYLGKIKSIIKEKCVQFIIEM